MNLGDYLTWCGYAMGSSCIVVLAVGVPLIALRWLVSWSHKAIGG
jgi:hypothetical protein